MHTSFDRMSTIMTRRNAGKATPATQKANKNDNEVHESENSDSEPILNLDSLSSEQKLDFLCKKVDELT